MKRYIEKTTPEQDEKNAIRIFRIYKMARNGNIVLDKVLREISLDIRGACTPGQKKRFYTQISAMKDAGLFAPDETDEENIFYISAATEFVLRYTDIIDQCGLNYFIEDFSRWYIERSNNESHAEYTNESFGPGNGLDPDGTKPVYDAWAAGDTKHNRTDEA